MKRTYESESDNDNVPVRTDKGQTRWSCAEDDLLRELVKKYDGKITAEMVSDFQKFHERSLGSIRGRWEQYLRENREPSTQWSAEEDNLLTILVERHGIDYWPNIVADFNKRFHTRTARSIRTRWCVHINNNRDWTEAEDALLIEAHKAHGNSWTTILKQFPDREYHGLRRRLIKLQPEESEKNAMEESQSPILSKHASRRTDDDRLSQPLSSGAMGDVNAISKHASGCTEDDRLFQFLSSGAMGDVNAISKHASGCTSTEDDRLFQFLSSGSMGDARPSEGLDSFFQESACSGPISGVPCAQVLQVQSQWTYDDDELLMNGFNMLLSFKELSKLLNRSVAECQSRSKLLIDKKGSVCSEGPTTSRLDGVPHYSIHVPSAASTQFFEEGDQGSVAAAPFPSSKAGLLGKHKAATGYDTGPSDERSTLPPALGGSFPQFDTGLHDFLADTEGLCGLDVFPAAGASSLSNEYGLLGPD